MSTLSLDDATIIRRLKDHVVRCKCCQDALRNKDGSGEPNQTIQPTGVTTSQNQEIDYNAR